LAGLILLAAVVAVAGVTYVRWHRPPSARGLQTDQVSRLRMIFLYQETAGERVIEGREQIQALLTLIAKGERTREHRCANLGELYFDLHDGRSVHVGLLPGHKDGYYEFRCDGGIFHIDRTTMLEVMHRAGVGRELLISNLENNLKT
jgi:hypothetical protein